MASSFLKRRPARSLLAGRRDAAGRSPFARAQTGLPAGNSELPINLEAASSDFDYKNNTLLFKRVKITQGGLAGRPRSRRARPASSSTTPSGGCRATCRSRCRTASCSRASARVMFRNNAIASASIKGTPAQFEQRLKENEPGARGDVRPPSTTTCKAGTVRLTGRCLAHRRQQRDSRQHAGLRHRPRARRGQPERDGPGRREDHDQSPGKDPPRAKPDRWQPAHDA